MLVVPSLMLAARDQEFKPEKIRSFRHQKTFDIKFTHREMACRRMSPSMRAIRSKRNGSLSLDLQPVGAPLEVAHGNALQKKIETPVLHAGFTNDRPAPVMQPAAER